MVIGRGGFGKVYKGTITNGSDLLTVAIKRLDSTSNQGASEFWAEVNMLSNLRHCHLVSLIGYCSHKQEMILVYEYISHGTLEHRLHNCVTHLSWQQRLSICIGAARGLDYLHSGTGVKHGIVHRDVKSSNILLSNRWTAKISDFGLSKICPKDQQLTHVSTGVKGTFGYLDPNYFYTGKLTRKSDVYAFGVVMFEVLCGKRAVDRSIDEDQWGLAIWAQDSIKEGRLKKIVDTNMKEGISPKCLKMFAQLAIQCVHTNPKQRPTMAEVVVGLESIMTLQEKANNKLQSTGMKFFAKKAPTIKNSVDELVIERRYLTSLELYLETAGGENHALHQFNVDTLNVATENFSEANKISKHLQESLYKGKLQNGQHIGIFRDLFGSTYEKCYMNEVSKVLKLEHENIIELLGYCIDKGTLFFVYEFALHSTLNRMMYDPECTPLNWDKRYKIIVGVARALLYLHKYAPVQIIHRDVKPENIFLDKSFDPKLSCFRWARANNESYSVRGTYDYMAPEYMHYEKLSTKADVYSFGLVVLETITGLKAKRETNLVNYVQRNWDERTTSNIIDFRIDVDATSLTKFIEIGLLCVQKEAAHRPTMKEVVDMLLATHTMVNMRASNHLIVELVSIDDRIMLS